MPKLETRNGKSFTSRHCIKLVLLEIRDQVVMMMEMVVLLEMVAIGSLMYESPR